MLRCVTLRSPQAVHAYSMLHRHEPDISAGRALPMGRLQPKVHLPLPDRPSTGCNAKEQCKGAPQSAHASSQRTPQRLISTWAPLSATPARAPRPLVTSSSGGTPAGSCLLCGDDAVNDDKCANQNQWKRDEVPRLKLQSVSGRAFAEQVDDLLWS